MTNKEAIKYLIPPKATSTEPSAEYLKQIEAYRMAVDALRKTQWIPCSEGLPEELAEVNITWVNTDPPSYYEFIKNKPMTGTAVYYKGHWYWYSATCVDYLKDFGESKGDRMNYAIKVIAWLPLPEPYKGDE